MGNWRTDAVLWFRDPERGLVLSGSFGFVWWATKQVFCAPFSEHQRSPLIGYKKYVLWSSVKKYQADAVTKTALIRFVRSGLLP